MTACSCNALAEWWQEEKATAVTAAASPSTAAAMPISVPTAWHEGELRAAFTRWLGGGKGL